MMCPAISKAQAVEQLWQDLFTDPSEWLDNRSTKRNEKSPDFVHSSTKEALWVDGRLTPPWVEAELALLAKAPPARGKRAAYQSTLMNRGVASQIAWVVTDDGGCASLEGLRKLCEKGQLDEALQALDSLKRQGCRIASIIASLLHGCMCKKDLLAARAVDGLMIRTGLGPHSFWGSHLIRTFGVCGCLLDAWRVFKRIPRPSVLTWNALVAAHIKCEQFEKAVELYEQMCQQSIKVNEHTFVAVFKACANTVALPKGQIIHCHTVDSGFESDGNVGSCLVELYAKCGRLKDAHRVFEKLSKQDILPWTAMIAGYTQHGFIAEAVELFQKMQQSGKEPNIAMFVSILKGCSTAAALRQGKCIHAQVVSCSFESDIYIGSSLIDCYIKCGQLQDARKVYNSLPKQDVVTWSSMMAGYVQHGYPEETLQLLQQMQQVT